MDFVFGPDPIVWVQEVLGSGHDELFRILGVAGTSWGLLLAAAIALWLFGRRVLYALLAVAVLEGLAREFLAGTFGISRPDAPSIVKYEQVGSSSSFPSAHVSTAAALWTFLGRATRFPLALSGAIVLLVALGRMYLGVHYLGDVVAGALLGAGIAWVWPRVAERLPVLGARFGFAMLATLAGLAAVGAVAFLALRTPDSPYLWRWGALVAAAAVALPLEWRYIRYGPADGAGNRVRAALVGAVGLAPLLLIHLTESGHSHAFGALLLFLGTLWVLLLAPALFARLGWSRNGRVERPAAVHRWARISVLVVLVGVAAVAYGSLVEPRVLLDVREETYELPALPDAWSGGRVALIADLQVGMWGHNTGMMERIVEQILDEGPDLVLIAGDFIYKPGSNPEDEVEEAVEIVAPLGRAGIPVFAVLGNHDWSVDHPGARVDEAAGQALERALEEAGIRVLRNDAQPVRRGRAAAGSGEGAELLWVAGIGSHWAGKDDPAAAVADVPSGAARVVFMHHPDSFEALPPGEAPLALAAHTHGGQFRLPFLPDWSWMTFAVEDKVHADGWTDRDYGSPGNRLYVSRGIGFSAIPVRIRARPELTFFTLEQRAGGGPSSGR